MLVQFGNIKLNLEILNLVVLGISTFSFHIGQYVVLLHILMWYLP